MGMADQQTKQKFPFPFEQVFDGLIKTLPENGFTLKTQDKLLGRIPASAGMSLFSYGEDITLIIEKIDETNSMLSIESSLKVGFNIGGMHRHQKNFDTIITSLSRYLQNT